LRAWRFSDRETLLQTEAVLTEIQNRVFLQEDQDEEAPQKKDIRRFLARPPVRPET